MKEVDWSKVDLDKSKFILEQSQKIVQNTCNNYDLNNLKIISMLKLLIFTLFFMLYALNFINKIFLINLIIPIIGFCISFFILCIAYKTRTVPNIGHSPSSLLEKRFVDGDLLYLMHCVLLCEDETIEEYNKINKKIGKYINISIKTIVISCAVSLILFLYLYFIKYNLY